MADTVRVTPLSRKIEFFDDAIEAEISLAGDGSGDLTISAPGQLNIGDTSTDIYIGDGSSNVDIVFEAGGEIRTSGAGVELSLVSEENIKIDTPLLNLEMSSPPNDHIALRLCNNDDGYGVGLELVNDWQGTDHTSMIYFDFYGTKLTSNSHGMIYRSGRAGFAHHHFVADDNTRQMMIADDGEVGIGPTFTHAAQPEAKLHLKGSGGGEKILIEDTGSNSNPALEIKNDAVHWKFQARGGDGDRLRIAESSTTHMVIETGGNVGIGEADPAYKLDVDGTGLFTGALTGAGSITSTEGDSNVELTQSTRGVFNGSASISSGSIVRIGNSAVHFGGSYVNDGGIFAVDAAETLFCVNYGADTLSSYDEYQSFEAHIYMGDDDNNRTRSVKVLGMWNGTAIDYTTWADLDESEEGFEISVASVTVDTVPHMGVIFKNRVDAIDQNKLNIRWSVNLLQAPTVEPA